MVSFHLQHFKIIAQVFNCQSKVTLTLSRTFWKVFWLWGPSTCSRAHNCAAWWTFPQTCSQALLIVGASAIATELSLPFPVLGIVCVLPPLELFGLGMLLQGGTEQRSRQYQRSWDLQSGSLVEYYLGWTLARHQVLQYLPRSMELSQPVHSQQDPIRWPLSLSNYSTLLEPSHTPHYSPLPTSLLFESSVLF